jgi:glucose-6-phosphate 1-dehydrogenase
MMQTTPIPSFDEIEPVSERLERAPDPCTMILFGASGDLARRKLVPALFQLFQAGLLPEEFSLVGAALPGMDDDGFRALMRDAVERSLGERGVNERAWGAFARGLYHIPMDVTAPLDYVRLGALLQKVERERRTQGNRIFYLAVSPALFGEVADRLGESGLARPDSPGKGWARIVVEKPFGADLATARQLNARLHRHFDEANIFRMDHYLGKEMVQNLLVLRFANGIFAPLWNRQHVEHVQVTSAETLGVEGRGVYYEQAGALRDMIQSHVFQVLSLLAMEPPASLDPEDVRDEKVRALASARAFTPERVRAECVRGQYGPGVLGGALVPGYRQEPRVGPGSRVETYAMLTMRFDSPRWSGVPFYVRTGKRLKERVTEVVVQFKEGLGHLFGAEDRGLRSANRLIIRIQPQESITLRLAMKTPGRATRVRDVDLHGLYAVGHGGLHVDGYERLLLDAMLGDSTLYTRVDMVERSWELVMPILEEWSWDPGVPIYPAGSWGPSAAGALLASQGDAWHTGGEAGAESSSAASHAASGRLIAAG